MGNYLAAPNASKECQDGSTDRVRYGTCAMQGWRLTMEDAHLVYLFDAASLQGTTIQRSSRPIALFGVYDGHGGPQVSQFVARHLIDELIKTPDFRKGRFDGAFRAAYVNLDQLLAHPQSEAELELLIQKITSQQTFDEDAQEQQVPNSLVAPILKESPVPSSVASPSCEVLSSNVGVSKSDVAAKVPPAKGRGFRSSVKLGSKKLYRRVGHHRRKTDDKDCSVDVLSSFESLGVSEEHSPRVLETPTPSDTTTARTSRLRKRRDSFLKKSVAANAAVATQNGLAQQPGLPMLTASNGAAQREAEHCALPTYAAGDTRNIEHTASQESSSGSVVNERRSTLFSASVDLVTDDVLSPIVPSSATPATSIFSFQGLKSLLSSVMRFGSSVGRQGATAPGRLAMLAGCTALSVLMTDTQIVVANAGDSRCVLCRGDVAVELSKDHKPGLAEERSRIYAAGGWLEMGRVNGNLNLSRAIGDLMYKSNTALPPERQVVSGVPDVVIVDITEQDKFLVIGCDGIWESSTSQDIVNFIRERIYDTECLSQVLQALFEELLSPNPTLFEFGCDNMTAILVDLQAQRKTTPRYQGTHLSSCDVAELRSGVKSRSVAESQSATEAQSLSETRGVANVSRNIHDPLSSKMSPTTVKTKPNNILNQTNTKKALQPPFAYSNLNGGNTPRSLCLDRETFWESHEGSPYASTRLRFSTHDAAEQRNTNYEAWERVVANAASSKRSEYKEAPSDRTRDVSPNSSVSSNTVNVRQPRSTKSPEYARRPPASKLVPPTDVAQISKRPSPPLLPTPQSQLPKKTPPRPRRT